MPKLVANANNLTEPAPSSEQLLDVSKLPPRPSEISDDSETEALERQFQRISNEDSESSTLDIDVETSLSSPQSPVSNALSQLHANLESRLQPFWSSVLPSRIVLLQIFASPHNEPAAREESQDQDAIDHGPVASQEVVTAADGSFQARFRIHWEDLCQHPAALHIAFGDPKEEHDLVISADLLPPPQQSSASSASSTSSNSSGYSRSYSPVPRLSPTASSAIRTSITHSSIRVISDIDDTIKLSGVVSGARAVFHNVFVKELKDIVIPGMGEWYTSLWERGVRFHYVVGFSDKVPSALCDKIFLSQTGLSNYCRSSAIFSRFRIFPQVGYVHEFLFAYSITNTH